MTHAYDVRVSPRGYGASARTTAKAVRPSTRDRLVADAAALFNTQGYAGTSIDDILVRSGLSKGALYNHFAGKDAIAEAAFDHAAARLHARLETAMAGVASPASKLDALLDVYDRIAVADHLPGGCPILNAAIEVDELDSPLRDRVRAAMTRWRELVETTALRAARAGEFRADVDADAFATILIATLEGGLVLAKLYDDPTHLHRTVAHLRAHVASLAPTG